MDVIEAINSRRSVRAFKPEPVPREVLEAIIEAALRAPSWENTQPWEFAVLGGGVMKDVKEALAAMGQAGEKPQLDFPWPKFSGPYLARLRADGRRLMSEIGLPKGDPEAIRRWRTSMRTFFDAPNAVVMYMDASLSQWSLVDMGIAAENLMLAAWHYGVGSCALAAAVAYPEVLRSILGLPESKRMVLGIALGYPDTSKPAATFRSSREPMETLVTWYGFD
ncbi:MAG: nitroreductase [Dehalococcoidia bacterium]|nr:nitroreductase [Dehalococcoidia bacterium]